MATRILVKGENKDELSYDGNDSMLIDLTNYVNSAKANSLDAYLTACELSLTGEEYVNLQEVHKILEGDISYLEGSTEVILFNLSCMDYIEGGKVRFNFWGMMDSDGVNFESTAPIPHQIDTGYVLFLYQRAKVSPDSVIFPTIYKERASFTDYIDLTCRISELKDIQGFVKHVAFHAEKLRGVKMPKYIDGIRFIFQQSDARSQEMYDNANMNCMDIALSVAPEYVNNLLDNYVVHATTLDYLHLYDTNNSCGFNYSEFKALYGKYKNEEGKEKLREFYKTANQSCVVLLVSKHDEGEARLLY